MCLRVPAWILVVLCLLVGCSGEDATKPKTVVPAEPPRANGPSSLAGGRPPVGREARIGAPFLDQTKQIPGGLEWVREITSKSGGTILFRVTCDRPFSVTLVTDRAYRAIQRRDARALQKEDVLLTVDSADAPVFEQRVTVPEGSSWFILLNRTDKPAEMRLQCYEAGQ